MRVKYLATVLVFLLLASCASERETGIDVLMLAPRSLGANYYLLRDVIEEYGWSVTHTAVLDTVLPCPWFATHGEVFPLIPDVTIDGLGDIGDYDCLMIAPSTGNAVRVDTACNDVIGSPDALDLITLAVHRGLPVYATCVGVRILAAAGVVQDRFIVGSPRFREEYIAAGANYVGRPGNDNPPTIDGNIITCARGQYYNYANVMAVATVIESHQGRGPKGSLNAGYISEQDVPLEGDGVAWARSFGGVGAEGGRAFCTTGDGGFLIVGYTFAPGSSDADLLALKVTSDGDMTWSRRYGGAGTEYGNGCLEIEDGYLIVGYTTSFGAGSKDLYLLKIDGEGNEVWSRTYGGKSWDVGTSICRAGESEYFVCGYTNSYGFGEEDIYLLKVSACGDTIWHRTMGGWRIDMANSIYPVNDGGCVIAASSGSYSENTDFYLAKVSADGDREWAQFYGAEGDHGHGFDWCKGASPTSDGGWLLTGYSDCNDMMDAVCILTDPAGNERWLTSFGRKPFYEYGNGVCEVAEGGYVIAGITKSMTRSTGRDQRIYNNDIYVVMLDPAGKVLWEKAIGGGDAEWANAVRVTTDGDIVALGHTDGGHTASLDVLLVKLSGLGEGAIR